MAPFWTAHPQFSVDCNWHSISHLFSYCLGEKRKGGGASSETFSRHRRGHQYGETHLRNLNALHSDLAGLPHLLYFSMVWQYWSIKAHMKRLRFPLHAGLLLISQISAALVLPPYSHTLLIVTDFRDINKCDCSIFHVFLQLCLTWAEWFHNFLCDAFVDQAHCNETE